MTRTAKLHVLRAVVPLHLQRRGVLGRLGAAWFYDCADVPDPLPILVAKEARTTTTLPRGFSLHQTAFSAFDRISHEDLFVTSPLRTTVDVALHVPGADGTRALHWLMASPHLHCPPELVLAAWTPWARNPGAASRGQGAKGRASGGTRLRSNGSVTRGAVHVVHAVDPAHLVEHVIQVAGVAHLEREPRDGQP